MCGGADKLGVTKVTQEIREEQLLHTIARIRGRPINKGEIKIPNKNGGGHKLTGRMLCQLGVGYLKVS